MGSITSCGSCGHKYLSPVLNMGMQPLAERESEPYPLRLMKCDQCTLVQLSYIVDENEMFPLEHPYATGNTQALRDHFDRLATYVADLMADDYGGLVVDIGANDGTFLEAVLRHEGSAIRVAVEPTNQAKKCLDKGIITFQRFFTPEVARDIVALVGTAQVIVACNVLAHVPDPHEFLQGVKLLLADDGVFITENHDWASISNGLQIDTVYHEHLRYYSPASLSYLLAKNGFTVSEIKPVNTHGGSFRTTAIRERNQIAMRAMNARGDLQRLLALARNEGKIYGVGACTRATPLIHYAKLDDYLSCVVEVPESEKIGTFMPGTKIPVVDEKKLIEDQPPHALLFAWHWASTIVPKLRAAGYKGKFIIPLPEPRIYNG
jgi:2-polyprenyl-3-methyl-5-hydroxy-6-metoxy-1,4-benzoquinol methylase